MKKTILAIALTFLLTGSSMACGISAFSAPLAFRQSFAVQNVAFPVVQRQVIRQRIRTPRIRRQRVRNVQIQRIRRPIQIQRFRSNFVNPCINGECLIF